MVHMYLSLTCASVCSCTWPTVSVTCCMVSYCSDWKTTADVSVIPYKDYFISKTLTVNLWIFINEKYVNI